MASSRAQMLGHQFPVNDLHLSTPLFYNRQFIKQYQDIIVSVICEGCTSGKGRLIDESRARWRELSRGCGCGAAQKSEGCCVWLEDLSHCSHF